MRFYRTTDDRWVSTQADAGKHFEAIDIPTDKPSLLQWLNDHEVVIKCNHDWGGPPSLGAECLICGDQCEEPVNYDGTPISPEPAPDPRRHVEMPVATKSWDVTAIEDFILNQASVADVESLFARIGTRFKELLSE